ncbi:MAG: alpha-galactosidase [Pseudomonadota bacterium]
MCHRQYITQAREADLTDDAPFISLVADQSCLVIDCAIGHSPTILYWGRPLRKIDGDVLKRLRTRQHAHGSADIEIPFSLFNETGSGVSGHPGFAAHRSGNAWAGRFIVKRVEQNAPNHVEILCREERTNIAVTHILALDAATSVLTCHNEIENIGSEALSIDWCAAANLPLDPRATRLLGFTGRWANEFQIEEIQEFHGSYVRENKSGRTSHDAFPGLIAAAPATSEQSGLCFGFHFGWRGNSRLRVERLNDGRAIFQMGEYFFPGEVTLHPGEIYSTPPVYASTSERGLSALSRQFHSFLRHSIMDGRIQKKPRPVHYNTWEAVYFDHDPARLFALAETAAEIGAERFVLDDGWFGSRRDDTSGLGDWWPSEHAYPDGLGPLVNHVLDLGMEFGLWFEPEMVNPDSDLFRAHPDWILQAEGLDQIPFRNQFVLDLTRPEASTYLFDRMDKILSDHPITYIKWDMNRDIHHPGSGGKPAAHRQTRAVYALIDRLRAAHPDLEIESCASGGGRADYGVLERTDRIWTSDSNDALDRQRIQRGASYFFPLEVLGAHVGPKTCHVTGRKLSMELRVATAFFGHFGMELNLLEETPEALETLKAGIRLHKHHRKLIHAGDIHRLETPGQVNAVGVVSHDRSEALVSWCNLTGHSDTLPGRLFFVGLDRATNYRVRIIWPDPVVSRTSPSVIDALDLANQGSVIPGDMLMHVGLQLPWLYPETCLIFHLEDIAEDDRSANCAS